MKIPIALLFSVVLFLTVPLVRAQTPNNLRYPALLKEVNRDIWLPYAKAYQTNDAAALAGVFSEDFLRIEPYAKRITNAVESVAATKDLFEKRKEQQEKTEMQFRFLERVITDNAASERGVYQLTFTHPDGKKAAYYEKFHALSRKENGRWKLVAFYSSHEKQTITPQCFLEALPLDHISKY